MMMMTMTSDPRFVTPAVKAMLRQKNRLMHAGRVEEANALARLIRTVITRRDTAWLRKVDTRTCTRAAWAKVRDVIGGGKRHGSQVVDGITAQRLNDRYAAVSTDHSYRATSRKMSAPNQLVHKTVTESEVFGMLDRLRPAATGLDGMPAWFLRLGAAIFAAPIAHLFNQSVREGIVPRQWKAATITPVPQVSKPVQPSDFQPISITSVLSRSLERHIVKSYIYPSLLEPRTGLTINCLAVF